jgi:hypothetical protein
MSSAAFNEFCDVAGREEFAMESFESMKHPLSFRLDFVLIDLTKHYTLCAARLRESNTAVAAGKATPIPRRL